jgi:hypothetical protein
MTQITRGSAGVWIIFVTALAFAPGLRAQNDPLIGHWMLDLAKSKYDPGPPPKSEMRVYEPFGGVGKGIKATFDRVDAAGRKVKVTFSAMYDGKDYKYNGPDADTIVLTRPDSNTLDATLKRNGHVVQTTHAVISSDGKTRTQTATGTNVQGQKFNNVLVFNKQGAT